MQILQEFSKIWSVLYQFLAKWLLARKKILFKGLCYNGKLEKFQKSSKMAKIGTLSLVSKVTKVLIIELLMSVARNGSDLVTRQDFMKKY